VARSRLSALAVISLMSLPACSSNDSSGQAVVDIFATASLIEAFTEIGRAFEVEFPDSSLRFNFASSSDLATQIIEGAPADVLASADTINLERVRSASIPTAESRVFATNSLEIIVEPGNPLGIAALADLSNPNSIFVTCDESVPIGHYTSDVLEKAGVMVSPKSYEENVKGIVNKVVLGEADAGIVFRTDVIAAGTTVQGIPIAPEFNVIAEYPIAPIGPSPAPSTLDFITFVTTSHTARDILQRHGFVIP